MRFPFNHTSLLFKIIFITSLILIIAISFYAWLNITLQESTIKNLIYEKAKIISEFIERNVIRSMEKGRHFEIHNILKTFKYKGIYKISVLSPDGIIKATTMEEELNKKFNNFELLLGNQHFVKEELIRGENGTKNLEKVFYFNTLILNHRECFGCHDPKLKIIGVLSVGNTLKEMEEKISKVKKDALITAVITIVSLSLILSFLFIKFVNSPLQKISRAMRKIEEGDLDARVEFKRKDEIGKLAKDLNVMIESLSLAKKEAERYHQELIQRADRMATIGELASGIAHEIRNPLAGIHGAMLVLSEGFPKEDKRREVMEEIQKQIYKLERLVKDLLSYARPSPKKYEKIDINQLLEKVVSFFVTQAGGNHKIEVIKNFTPLPSVMVDPDSMEQVFLNIILNAEKAMPMGGRLTISTQPIIINKIEGIKIIFEDTGIGIPKENIGKIFNPFFSTRPNGTGLGLSITKNIVERHGGKIEVESEVDVGTKVIIFLPSVKSG